MMKTNEEMFNYRIEYMKHELDELKDFYPENNEKKELEHELLEKLASLEHEQWCDWSKAISEDYKKLLDIIDFLVENSEMKIPLRNKIFLITQYQRLIRWKDLWIPYNELSDELKESDREYAKKVLKKLNRETEY